MQSRLPMMNSIVRGGLKDLPRSVAPSRRSETAGDRTTGATFPEMLRAGSVPVERQIIGRQSLEGQDPVSPPPSSGQPTLSGWSIFGRLPASPAPPPSANAPASAPPTSVAPVYATKAEADAAVVKALKESLSAAGISFDQLGLGAHEDVVTYPGGAYLNRYISVNVNGHTEGLGTDLVSINPRIAVLDIKRMLGMV